MPNIAKSGFRQLKLFKTAWGQTGSKARYKTLAEFIRSAAEEGYDGVEFPIPYIVSEAGLAESVSEQLAELMSSLGLEFIALIATRPEDWSDEVGHREAFSKQLHQAVNMGAKKAAVHAGADCFKVAQSISFFDDCHHQARESGLDACFETHRGRPMADPFRTAEILEKLPYLRLTSDLSHWMVVIDRIPDDCMELFNNASCHSGHIHARIGYEKGPQVPNPRDPIWSEHINFYHKCWQVSVDAAKAREEVISASPEFGPHPYMNAYPFTQQPVADIKEVNDWMYSMLDRWFNQAN